MNIGPNQPSSGGGGGRRNRRRRMRRGPGQHQGQNQGNQSGQQNQQHMGGGGGGRRRRQRGRDRQPSVFSGPMDHSYRNAPGQNNGSGGQRQGGRRGQQPQRFFQHPEIEPVSSADGPQPLIFAFVDDLFFSAKIQETARKLNIKVNFVKNEQEVFDQLESAGVEANGNGQNGSTAPALVIFDLNSNSGKPLQTIHKLKQRFKRATNIIGFLSHLQGDLKLKAIEAGCDMVVPRSAFSQNLPQLLRRHATTAEEETA